MLRLAATAAAVGFLTASCAGGHGSSSLLPRSPSDGGRSARDVAIVAPAGWAATATRGATIPGATDRGALPATTRLTVRVGLNLRNADQLAAALAQPRKGAAMTP